MKIENWRIEELTGYKPITSFYTDFSIADRFGTTAIQDTYNRALRNGNTTIATSPNLLWF